MAYIFFKICFSMISSWTCPLRTWNYLSYFPKPLFYPDSVHKVGLLLWPKHLSCIINWASDRLQMHSQWWIHLTAPPIRRYHPRSNKNKLLIVPETHLSAFAYIVWNSLFNVFLSDHTLFPLNHTQDLSHRTINSWINSTNLKKNPEITSSKPGWIYFSILI